MICNHHDPTGKFNYFQHCRTLKDGVKGEYIVCTQCYRKWIPESEETCKWRKNERCWDGRSDAELKKPVVELMNNMEEIIEKKSDWKPAMRALFDIINTMNCENRGHVYDNIHSMLDDFRSKFL